ncbi:MAG: DUF5652 family protein [Candidatus Margulisiibacteriota bacterium]|nr:DUF5652 family protein [Candidatus Margulisiibacteriota bacterium]
MSQELSMNLLIVVAIIWSIIWKGIALWKASRNNQWGWFIAILVINTLGLLEILYLAGFQWDKNR